MKTRMRTKYQYAKVMMTNQTLEQDSNIIFGTSIVRSELPDVIDYDDQSDEDCCLDSEDDDKN